MKTSVFASAVFAAAMVYGGDLLQQVHPRTENHSTQGECCGFAIASGNAGRIGKIFVRSGDAVRKGDKLVQMQTDELEVQKESAAARVKVCEAEIEMAYAKIEMKRISLGDRKKEYQRMKDLLSSKAVSQREYDKAEADYLIAQSEMDHARFAVMTAEGKVAMAKAELQRIEVSLKHTLLTAPCDGRVQAVAACEGEAVAAGQRVLVVADAEAGSRPPAADRTAGIRMTAGHTGYVGRVFVRKGDSVRKGDQLLQMQTDMPEAQRALIQAEIKVLEGELEMAKVIVEQKSILFRNAGINYQRSKKLLEMQAMAERNYDRAENAYLTAKAELEYAKAALLVAESKIAVKKAEIKHIEVSLRRALLTAPCDGRVRCVTTYDGAAVAAGQCMLILDESADGASRK